MPHLTAMWQHPNGVWEKPTPGQPTAARLPSQCGFDQWFDGEGDLFEEPDNGPAVLGEM